MFRIVGRATVPAVSGRHGGRPYDAQGQSFFSDQTGCPLAGGGARVKLHKNLTASRRISNIEPQNGEGWNRCAQSFLKLTEYITLTFAIRHSMFICFFFRYDQPPYWPAAIPNPNLKP